MIRDKAFKHKAAENYAEILGEICVLGNRKPPRIIPDEPGL